MCRSLFICGCLSQVLSTLSYQSSALHRSHSALHCSHAAQCCDDCNVVTQMHRIPMSDQTKLKWSELRSDVWDVRSEKRWAGEDSVDTHDP